ncbi:hypothetical protein DSO57_1019536 [Entomophthora muscae]|uniref:Uncharacterized protein n=1 Tax=Entomophthora muscae TaxID=34485 RepID=A0ACC2RIT0_9FUNG|nr:hypothetical protein DSO57_1019536 [Entomophthora muscae]
MIRVPSEDQVLYTIARHPNKLMSYLFCFCSYTGSALLDTGADQTLVNSNFMDKFRLTTNPLQIKNVVLADEHQIAMTQETFRNIPDINQILTEVPCWGKIGNFTVKNSQFDVDFPLLGGKNKNNNKVEIEFDQHWINLSSRQAPATPASTLCQPPSTHPVASGPLASLPPARLLPPSQPAANRPPASPLFAQPAAHLLAPWVSAVTAHTRV